MSDASALAQRAIARLEAAATEALEDKGSPLGTLLGPSIAACMRLAADVVREELAAVAATPHERATPAGPTTSGDPS